MVSRAGHLGRPVGPGDDRARCATSTTPTGCPTSRCMATRARPTPRATPPSAASAGRRARSRSRTSSTASRANWAAIRSTCGASTSTARASATSRPTASGSATTSSTSWSPSSRPRSDYRARRDEIAAFNATSPVLKRGIALTPLKFGISFNVKHFNQAGALVHVYTDGSILVNHGGTEMGQGLNTKVAQVVAHELGVSFERVRVHRDRHPEGGQHLGHRGLHRRRPERQGGAGRRAPDPRAAGRLRRGAPRRRGGAGALRQRQGRGQRPHAALRRPWSARPTSTACSSGPTASTPRPGLHWDKDTMYGPAVLLLRLWRGGAARWSSTR